MGTQNVACNNEAVKLQQQHLQTATAAHASRTAVMQEPPELARAASRLCINKPPLQKRNNLKS